MDSQRPAYSLKAPGRSGTGSLHLPGRDAFPGLDDRLVDPEDPREEVIGGRRVTVSPALEPHAFQNSEIALLLRLHAVSGYRAAVDMLTRFDATSDFASDACLYRFDPDTGERSLEEIAFEVVSEQNESVVREKAVRMHRRGVRRIFAAFVKGTQRVCEWEPKSQSWHLLDRGAAIEDVILIRPLPVVALLDAAEADNAAVEALRAKNHPKLQEIHREGHREGRREALQEVLLDLLKEKFGGLEEGVQERIAQADPALLKKWIVRAATATRLGDVVGLS
jgi:hypothetical protein